MRRVADSTRQDRSVVQAGVARDVLIRSAMGNRHLTLIALAFYLHQGAMSSSELSEQPDEEPSSPQLPPVRNPDSDTHEGYADSSPVRVRSDDEEVLEQEEEPELDEAVEWQMAQIAQFASSEHEADSVDSRDVSSHSDVPEHRD